jgi:hypothetical protein
MENVAFISPYIRCYPCRLLPHGKAVSHLLLLGL